MNCQGLEDSSAGIRPVGARIAGADERKAAYLLYEKGRTLLSAFIVPLGEAQERMPGRCASFHGDPYLLDDSKGYRSVARTDGSRLFGFVSALDYDAL